MKIEKIVEKIFSGEISPEKTVGPNKAGVFEKVYSFKDYTFVYFEGGCNDHIDVYKNSEYLGMALASYPDTWGLV